MAYVPILTKTLLQQNYLLENKDDGSSSLLGLPSTSCSVTKHS